MELLDWCRAMSELSARSEGWVTILPRLSQEMLFNTAIASEDHMKLVNAYRTIAAPRTLSPYARDTLRRTDALRGVPPEIVEEILLLSSMKTRIAFGQTSVLNRHLACNATRMTCCTAIQRYRLTYADVHFLQEAVGVIISGSTVTRLFNDDNDFTPGDLDIYCPDGRGLDIASYLATCAGYITLRRSDDYDNAQGIRSVAWLINPANEDSKINIIESLSDNAIDAVLHFHSTAVMGAWVAGGLWHAYPKATFANIALTSPDRLPLNYDEPHSKAPSIIEKYTLRGYRFVTEWDADHVCGVSRTCPVTLRTTVDSGCLWMPFSARFSDGPHMQSNSDPVSWMLGRAPCSRSGKGTSAVYFAATSLHKWKSLLEQVVNGMNVEIA
ncbi:hypothetical protein DFH06DRAFT_1332768 [Mycena polygramma]|nr:hypothetical protein DFH06DRAFT_1335364 [Mycena polygramma]KAJ7646400.1 hypothetical protein DFH06DRAFT_1332768 [Mycena polygramma]